MNRTTPTNDSPAASTPIATHRIRRMRQGDAPAVAAYHAQELRADALTNLGEKNLARLYRTLNGTGDSFVFVAVDPSERVIGFISGVTHTNRLYRRVVRESMFSFARIGFKAFSVRRTIREALNANPGSKEEHDLPIGKLFSIVIDSEHRDSDVAGDLLNALLEEFRARGVAEVRAKVGSDLDRADAFYVKYGFQRVGESGDHGTSRNIYTIHSGLTKPSGPPRVDPFCTDPNQIARSWYVPPSLPHRRGWLLYSEQFVLEAIQGSLNDSQSVRRTPLFVLAARVLLCLMAFMQTLLMLLSWIPGVGTIMYAFVRLLPRNPIGFFFRGCYWKTRLAGLGVDTLIDQGVEFTQPGRIEIGSRSHVDRNVSMTAAEGGYIRVGDNTTIGAACLIAGRGGVWIGDFVGISPLVHIYSVTNQPFDLGRRGELLTMSHMAPLERQSTLESPVRIEDYAVIGFNSLIMPGVNIGRGAVIHAFGEVRASIPPFGVATGHGLSQRKGWRRPGAIDSRLTDEKGRAD